MCKEGIEQQNEDLKKFLEGKKLEKSCLVKAINKVPRLQKFKVIDDDSQERPDFVLEKDNNRIGIEHFHIDLLYIDRKKHTSLARYTYNDLRELLKKYNEKVKNNNFKNEDAEDAGSKLEEIINEIIDCHNKFDYDFFIKEWNRIFNKHYKNRNEYKTNNNLNELGFLIEIRRYSSNSYVCHKKNGTYMKSSIPITKEISECLNQYKDGVDFIIIIIEGLFDDYVGVQYYDKNKVAKSECDYFELKKIPRKVKINIKD